MLVWANYGEIQWLILFLEVGFRPGGSRIQPTAVLFWILYAHKCILEPAGWLEASELPAPRWFPLFGQRLPEVDCPLSFTIPLRKSRKNSQLCISEAFAFFPRQPTIYTKEVLSLPISRGTIAPMHFIGLTGAVHWTALRIECHPRRPQ